MITDSVFARFRVVFAPHMKASWAGVVAAELDELGCVTRRIGDRQLDVEVRRQSAVAEVARYFRAEELAGRLESIDENRERA